MVEKTLFGGRIPDWRKYLVDIWQISGNMNVDVGIARSMFFSMVMAGKPDETINVEGTSVDFEQLHNIWVALPAESQNSVMESLRVWADENYKELCAAWREKDMTKFRDICDRPMTKVV